MNPVETKILKALRLKLKHGDVTKIADETGMSRQHVSRCLNLDIDLFDMDVVSAAKEFIAKRERQAAELLTSLTH